VSSWDPGRKGSAAAPMREGSAVLSSLFVKVRHSERVSMILSARTRPGHNVSISYKIGRRGEGHTAIGAEDVS
jgi:hypothetical protein